MMDDLTEYLEEKQRIDAATFDIIQIYVNHLYFVPAVAKAHSRYEGVKELKATYMASGGARDEGSFIGSAKGLRVTGRDKDGNGFENTLTWTELYDMVTIATARILMKHEEEEPF